MPMLIRLSQTTHSGETDRVGSSSASIRWARGLRGAGHRLARIVAAYQSKERFGVRRWVS